MSQPFEVFDADVTATMRCNCDPMNNPVLISTVHGEVQCGRCRSYYRIVEVHYEPSSGRTGIMMRVGRRDPEPATESPRIVTPRLN